MYIRRTRMADNHSFPSPGDLDMHDIDRRPLHVYTQLSMMMRMLRSNVSWRGMEYYSSTSDNPGHIGSRPQDLLGLSVLMDGTGTISRHCHLVDDPDSVESDVPYRCNTRMEYVLDTEVYFCQLGIFLRIILDLFKEEGQKAIS